MVKMHIEWLRAANDDLVLLADIIANPHITHLIAFHSQQAVEKSLKAYLEYNNEEVPKTHKIQSLIDRTDIKIEGCDDLIQLLDALYIESRYPGDMGLLPYGKPTLEDAREFYDFANNIFAEVCKILSIYKEELQHA